MLTIETVYSNLRAKLDKKIGLRLTTFNYLNFTHKGKAKNQLKTKLRKQRPASAAECIIGHWTGFSYFLDR